MTDYFALLEQPRAPWLDPAALKEIFHRKTLEQHPDSGRGTQSAFAALNEAYQVLQDPKRRLHHLLSLVNHAPPANNKAAPGDLQELFLQIAALNQNVLALLEKLRAASNPLTKSLLKAEIVVAQNDVGRLREKVGELNAAAEAKLRETDASQLDQLIELYQRFAYLGRWAEQLDELAFQLSL